MNKFEFTVSGKLLFGQSWKNDMARMLGFSVAGKMVSKVSTGDRAVSEQVRSDISLSLRIRATLLEQAANFIDHPYKIDLYPIDGMYIYIDKAGISSETGLNQSLIDQGAIVLSNISIKASSYFDSDKSGVMRIMLEEKYIFQNMIVQECFESCQANSDFKPLLDVMMTYFELPECTAKELEQQLN